MFSAAEQLGRIKNSVREIEGAAHIDDHHGAQIHDLCQLIGRLVLIVECQQQRLDQVHREVMA